MGYGSLGRERYVGLRSVNLHVKAKDDFNLIHDWSTSSRRGAESGNSPLLSEDQVVFLRVTVRAQGGPGCSHLASSYYILVCVIVKPVRHAGIEHRLASLRVASS